jgi:hypothetical protein
LDWHPGQGSYWLEGVSRGIPESRKKGRKNKKGLLNCWFDQKLLFQS